MVAHQGPTTGTRGAGNVMVGATERRGSTVVRALKRRASYPRVVDEFNIPPQAPLTLRGGRVLEEAEGEAHVPTQQPEASQAAWLSAAHADPRRPGDRPGTAPKGPRPAVGLIGRINDRATFDALRREGRRARWDPVTVVYLSEAVRDGGGAAEGARVAYSIGRRVGTAVVRNRVRRRLRAAMREVDRERGGLSPGAYLVLAHPEAGTAPYAELKRSLGAACDFAVRDTNP
jgi:ribonuclease P protein component